MKLDWQCPACGYSLRGLVENRRPECGNAFDPAQLQASLDKRWALNAVLTASVASCVLFVLVLILSSIIQHAGWPAQRGPQAREWIIHNDNVASVPSYVPLTVWLPMGLLVAGVIVIGVFTKLVFQPYSKPAMVNRAFSIFAILAVASLCFAYQIIHFFAMCCE